MAGSSFAKRWRERAAALEKAETDAPADRFVMNGCFAATIRSVVDELEPIAARWRAEAANDGTPGNIAECLRGCARELVGNE
jgi:hypothetical protein